MTHVALSLGHIDGVLNIRWNSHLVINGLALLLLKLGFVQFLQSATEMSRKAGCGRVMIRETLMRKLYPADELVDLPAVGGVTSLGQSSE